MLVLNHTAQNGRRITEVLPEIVEEPVYVECIPGQPIEIALKPHKDFRSEERRVGKECL